MRTQMTTWRKKIGQEMARRCETFENVVACTLSEAELDVEFDGGYGWPEGTAFTLWTEKRVYFPAHYDGFEWVESVSRNPDWVPTEHVGGAN